MSGNYDDIIKQVLAAKGKPLPVPTPEFSDQDMLMPYPVHTAKVPPDRLPDTPWRQEIPPITGDQTTPRIQSNEAAADVVTRQRMADVTRQIIADPSRAADLQKSYEQLVAQSPSMLQARRNAETRAAVPGDADAMMQAIQRRQQLGRSE